MLAGHVAVGLGLKARYREVPFLLLLLSVVLLDVIWLVLVWREVEPLRFFFAAGARQCDFHEAVYSHSLFWSCFYALVVFLLFVRAEQQRQWAVPLSLGVLSHWLLDALVHSDLPFANFGADLRLGIGLFSLSPLLALGLESVIAFTGWWLYCRSRASEMKSPWPGWMSLAVLLLLFLFSGLAGRIF